MNIGSDQSVGLVDTGQRHLEWNTKVGAEGEIWSAVFVIPATHETTFRGISINAIMLQIKK
jgi:hypothetical protein